MLMLRVGGVAEHYNLPWQLVKESGKLEDIGIDLQWRDCLGGTGEMTKLLRNSELDMAILLTEGIVSDILMGGSAKILSVFVQSSLEWGVHVANQRKIDFTTYDDPLKFVVSRMGSGSHLMALLYAKQNGIHVENVSFEEVGSLDGAMDAFRESRVDAFLWERFTTEPYCQKHDLVRVDSIHTPWPCFVIAVRPDFYEINEEQITELLIKVFNEASNLKNNSLAIQQIADRYQLSKKSVGSWFAKVEWGKGENLSLKEVDNVIDFLKESGSLGTDLDVLSVEKILMKNKLMIDV